MQLLGKYKKNMYVFFLFDKTKVFPWASQLPGWLLVNIYQILNPQIMAIFFLMKWALLEMIQEVLKIPKSFLMGLPLKLHS